MTTTTPDRTRPGVVGLASLWAGVVLSLGTMLLSLYVVGLALVGSIMLGFGSALGLLSGDGSVDVGGLVVRAVTCAVAAWAVGLAVARWLAPGGAAPPWAVGLFAGLLGCCAGAVVLALVGLL